jgi:hypothetical protein
LIGEPAENLKAAMGQGRIRRLGEKQTAFGSLVVLKKRGSFRTKNGEALATQVKILSSKGR